MIPKLKLPEDAELHKIEGRKYYSNALDRDERKILKILKDEDPDLAIKFILLIGKLLTPLGGL